MKDFIRHHKKLAAFTALGALLCALSAVEWRPVTVPALVRGQTEALFDVARGHYQLLGYGLSVAHPESYPLYVCLRERYGINFRRIAGCAVSDSLVSYVDSYNAITVAAANRKFGHDVYRECKEVDRKYWVQATAKKNKAADH